MKLNIKSMTSMVHHFFNTLVPEGSRFLDATTGNGHDTLFLARLAGPEGKVYGFDIQEAAIKSTEKRLAKHELLDRVELKQLSNELVSEVITEELDGAIYNLGYLPGGDHSIITTAEATVSSLKQTLSLLKPGGIAAVVAYVYHPGGREEAESLEDYLATLDEGSFVVTSYSRLNSLKPSPLIYFIKKNSVKFQ